jgi:DhnA family fructose-bisphosphate aldolase class Ia
MLGKQIRLERIVDRNTKKTVIVPLVHGIGMGPIEGIKDIANVVDVVSLAGANSIVLNKGIIRRAHRGAGKDIGLIISLSGSCDSSDEAQICTVEEAIKLGADAVRASIPARNKIPTCALEMLGNITQKSSEWGVPFIVMVGLEKETQPGDLALITKGARIGAEMGADLVTVPYPGSMEALRELVGSIPVPVVVKGGEKTGSELRLLEMVKNSMQAGAIGVSVGRNVFQYKKPGNMIKAISAIVHGNASAEKAAESLREKPLESPIFSHPLW